MRVRVHLLLVLAGSAYAAQNYTTPLLILGAGMTGLTAAYTLASKHGISDYILLDAQPMLGGRMQTYPFGGQTIELGANWVQGLTNPDTNLTNPVWTLAQTYNLSTTYSNYSDVLSYDENGPLGDGADDAWNDWDDAFGNFLEIAGTRQNLRLTDFTARAGLRLGGWQPLDYIYQAVEFFNFDMEYSQTPDESSWIQVANNNNFTFNDFSADNNFVIDPRGFSTVATAPYYSLSPSKRGTLLLNSTVVSISHSSADGVVATLADNSTITARYALCTFSVGVLQYGDIEFDPPLPQWKEDAIQGFAMTTYTKIFLQFDTKFWADSQFQMYASPHLRGYYTQFQSLDAEGFFPGSRILFTTVTDQNSVRVESMTDAAVQAEIVAVLQNMYGAENVGNVTAFYFPRWHSNPLFRGSYSNWPASYLPASQTNLGAAIDGRLLFAGEATSFKYFGFLQGAYEEGVRAADSVARCLKVDGRDGCLDEVVWGEVLTGHGSEKMHE